MAIAVNIKANKTSTDIAYHEWLHKDSFKNSKTYKKFLNWVSCEFILNLQDDTDGLIIFFPNGSFIIKEIISKRNAVNFKIEVKSKCSKNGISTFEKIIRVLNHVKTFQK